MGNNISTAGDIFFPDNPSRRRRAQELQQQILDFGREFKQLHATRYDCPLPPFNTLCLKFNFR